jgi:multiple sugar transport system permease protein
MSDKQRKGPSSGPIVRGAAADAAAPALPTTLGWKQRHQLIGSLFLLPAVLYVAIFYVYPILLNVVMSFERYTAKSFVTGEAPFIGFANFNRLFSNPDFTVALQNTLLFTLGSLIFQFTIGLALAVVCCQIFWDKRPLKIRETLVSAR